MNVKAFDVKRALLISGKREFLSHGFSGASLRAICRSAGVTTGAFYSYFSKKEELFEAIVEPTLKKFRRIYEKTVSAALSGAKTGEQYEGRAIEFIYSHREDFRLMLDCSEGTAYEGFREKLLNGYFMEPYQACFDRCARKSVKCSVVRIMVSFKFSEYMELIYGEHSTEELKELSGYYAAFTDAGFASLIERLKCETA